MKYFFFIILSYLIKSMTSIISRKSHPDFQISENHIEKHYPGVNLYSYNIENQKSVSDLVVVYIHGLFAEGELLENVAIAIMKGEQRIAKSIMIDLPNHGKSDRKASMTFEGISDDVIAHLDILGIKEYIIFSHSIGSKTAMLMSMKRPSDIKGLVILDTYPLDYIDDPEVWETTVKIIETLMVIDISHMAKQEVEEMIANKLVGVYIILRVALL
jgi:pimeloyl-ACP methyl ester carboxylesterase